MSNGAKEEILRRIRSAAVEPVMPTSYVPPLPRPGSADKLAEMIGDYRARVRICDEAGLPAVLAEFLEGTRFLAAADGVPWEIPFEKAEDLDAPGVTVLTGCALAIAETGTIVLDTGAAQGNRAMTLIPDHHVCVVHEHQIVADVPDGIAAIADPTRPLTFISGPSATSDIELERVEGVHGPRKLDVVIVRTTKM
ncbi:MAG TPA: LUD domain-containing protein [Candidatus Limnocylindrales bacterium]|nr:LUD domain-containing protein [Candidatus Limnocylindrales bacterium]